MGKPTTSHRSFVVLPRKPVTFPGSVLENLGGPKSRTRDRVFLWVVIKIENALTHRMTVTGKDGWEDRRADRLTDRLLDCGTDSQTDKLGNRQTYRLGEKKADRQTDSQAERHRQTNRKTSRETLDHRLGS